MKRFISLLLSALMLVSVLAGCGGGNNSGGNNSGGNGSGGNGGGDAEEKVVTLRNTAFMTTCDPMATTNTHDYTVHENIYEGLYDLNEATGGYDLRLAEKIEANDDATEYIVTLKQGVKFHNGETMTADDVVFSYDYALSQPKMTSYTRPLDHCEKIDDSTVKIVMNQSFSPIGHLLHKVKILSQKEVTAQGDNFGKIANKAGTGPFMWDENNYDPKTTWSAVAFDDYHRGRAKIDRIVWNVIEDDTSAITALQNGEVDYMVVPISYWEDVKNSGKFTTVEKQSNEVMLFAINVESEGYGEILQNDKVRLAMMYALDRDGINKLVCDGYGAPTYMYINPKYAAAAPKDESLKNPIPFDLEKAKALLAEAGYPDGVDVGEFIAAAGRNESYAIAVHAQLEAAGTKSKLVVQDYSVVSDRQVAQEYELGMYYDCGNYDFNNFEQQSASTAIGITNVTFTGASGKFAELSKKFDQWLKDGSSTADEAKRIEIYTEMYNAYYDTHTQVPVIIIPSCIAYNKNLNAVPVPTDYRVYDWSWN